jgi:hypothetical protein
VLVGVDDDPVSVGLVVGGPVGVVVGGSVDESG